MNRYSGWQNRREGSVDFLFFLRETGGSAEALDPTQLDLASFFQVLNQLSLRRRVYENDLRDFGSDAFVQSVSLKNGTPFPANLPLTVKSMKIGERRCCLCYRAIACKIRHKLVR